MRRFLLIASTLVLLSILAGFFSYQKYQEFLDTGLNLPTGGLVFQVEPGLSGSMIIKRLSESDFTRDSWHWKLLMRLEPPVIKVGEYQLLTAMLPRDLLQLLSSGDVVQYRFTVVEGWTFTQLLEALAANRVLQHSFDRGIAHSGEDSYLPMLSNPGFDHPEGWFFPETYQFTRGDSDAHILERAHGAMNTELAQAWASRLTGLPLKSPYELLILASIIEKETGLDEERGQIAGVFIRRLQKGMRLQTDPTVIYGMGDAFDGNIRRRDLKTDTPYNTYTRFGLPPTPIAMPGRASLLAAANPVTGDALYFVADGSGGHTFSVTLQQHSEAVNRVNKKN